MFAKLKALLRIPLKNARWKSWWSPDSLLGPLGGDGPVMGERMVAQEALFYSFNLKRHVPADHLLRSIDPFVDLSGICEHLRRDCSNAGRLSRSRADDPDADHRRLHGDQVRATAVQGVHLNLAIAGLPARSQRPGARSPDPLQEPARFRDSVSA